MIKNFVNIFHAFIIAGVLFSFSGCGFKANPVYKPSDKQQITEKQ
jgi:predicted small lipoprotein YifL